MAEQRFLLFRMSALGDIVHALPAAAALRDTFPGAHIDWLVDAKWARVLEGNSSLTEAISLDGRSAKGITAAIRKLRAAKYTCAIDFQGLYRSALLGLASGAPRRIGFRGSYARESFSSTFYTEGVNPIGAHKVEHNLTLVGHAGARKSPPRFPLVIREEDDGCVARELSAHGLGDFFVLNPGGGWLSKCWPAARYGELHRGLVGRHGWRGVVTFGPGEENLAREVILAAGKDPPAALPLGLGPLLALLRRAKFVVSADTGPLHLAAALGAPVVGLYGPTDPARNGPYSQLGAVVRNLRFAETTYRRGASYSAAMLSITVDQVAEAVDKRLGVAG